MAMHIIDRRLNPSNKSLENRQRFLRRAKALIQGAVKKSSAGRDIKDVLEGGEVSMPLEGMNEPRFHREGGTRDLVLPGNKKFVEGDILPRSDNRGGKASESGQGDGEDAFRFVLSRDEFVDLFLDDLELPDLAKRNFAEIETEGFAARAMRPRVRRQISQSSELPGSRRRAGSRSVDLDPRRLHSLRRFSLSVMTSGAPNSWRRSKL